MKSCLHMVCAGICRLGRRPGTEHRYGAITIDGLIKFSGRCGADQGHRRF